MPDTVGQTVRVELAAGRRVTVTDPLRPREVFSHLLISRINRVPFPAGVVVGTVLSLPFSWPLGHG